MSKRRPVLILARAHHAITPSAGASASSASAASSSGASSSATAVAGTKRKRVSNAVLISSFHQLQRRQEVLLSQKGKISSQAYSQQKKEIDDEIEKLGGLQAYQQLSIAGHNSSKYGAFNSAHWIVDQLADAGFGLQSLKGKHTTSGDTYAASSSSVSSSSSSSHTTLSATAEAKKLAKRQKERERKRAKKRAKLAAEGGGKTASSSKKEQQDDEDDDEENETSDREENDDDDDDNNNNKDATDAADDLIQHEQEGGFTNLNTSSQPKPHFTPQNRMKLLDVGAITNHYLPYSSLIDSTAIDLNPQHPSVKKQDFFELPFEKLRETYDCVVLSLVLNYVGERFRRGEMIQRSIHLLKSNGYARLFIVLPSACLLNSRWMNHELFVTKCMIPLGMHLGKFKYSNKLCFFEFVKGERKEVVDESKEESKEEPTEEEVEPEAEAQEEDEPMEESAEDKKKTKAQKKFEAKKKQLEAKKKAASEKKKSAAAAKNAKPVKKKGFQPAGIVLEGETRNNFSIAWRADLC